MLQRADSSEASIYLIDAQFRIVYMNEALQARAPEVRVGDHCYEALCGERAPCENCPLQKSGGDVTIFYNKMLQRWEEVNTGKMNWPGAGECSVLVTREFRKDNKNLMYNLANLSAYDELFEINATKDSYTMLYHEEGKYQLPPGQGPLRDTLQEVARSFIHPDDKAAFLAFWDMDTLEARLRESSGSDGAVKGQFRKLRVDGTWGWVLQNLAPLRGGGQDERMYLCFLQDIDQWKKQDRRLEDDADPLTGLYRREAFLERAQTRLQGAADEPLCLVALDIEHFKLFNEWYGRQAGDRFLQNIGGTLQRMQEKSGGVAGYMGEDNFVILLPDEQAVLTELQTYITGYMKHCGDRAGFQPAFGIYAIADRTEDVISMYDRALVALNSVKGNYTQRVCRYDAGMLRQMARDHRLLTEVQQALERGEFTFYAQPKCNMTNGKIVGAESLVRWIHPERGLIPPGEFLPLLESNGFISDLDRYIWEEVCRSVRNWIDEGHRPIPISVNVSRMDIYALDVVATFRELIEKYDLDPALIELEITESAYVEEYEIIPKVVDELRQAGFTVLMDDFGSGYSSLNMLKDVQVDILKIDMKFLEMSEQSAGKGVGIMEAIIGMARLMGLRFIAEGVETREQMEFLLNLGCDYGQGYYYYRPLPREEFEALLLDEKSLDFRGVVARQFQHLRIKDLLNENVVSETMMNRILGGIAFYDVCGDSVTRLQANEQYFQILGIDPAGENYENRDVLAGLRSGERQALLDLFHLAKDKQPGCAEGDIRRSREDGSPLWVHLRAFFLREQDGHLLCYGSISDVTLQMGGAAPVLPAGAFRRGGPVHRRGAGERRRRGGRVLHAFDGGKPADRLRHLCADDARRHDRRVL